MSVPDEIQRLLSDGGVPFYTPGTPITAARLWRDGLARGISALLDPNQGSAMVLYPLTYSVLQLADRMVTSPEVDPSATFPSTEMGDQSAVIVTRALLEAALRISLAFDRDQFLPAYGQCSDFRCGAYHIEAGVFPQFYLDYISTAHQVLEYIFMPGRPGYARLSIFDGMGEDEWELKAHLEIYGWLSAVMSREAFGRALGCLVNRVGGESVALQEQLRRLAESPSPVAYHFTRRQSRAVLTSVLNELRLFNGTSSCRRR